MKKKIVTFIICIPFCLIGIYHTITVPVPIPPDLISVQNVVVTNGSLEITAELFRSADTFSHFTYDVEGNQMNIKFYRNNILKMGIWGMEGSYRLDVKLQDYFQNINKVCMLYRGEEQVIWESQFD